MMREKMLLKNSHIIEALKNALNPSAPGKA